MSLLQRIFIFIFLFVISAFAKMSSLKINMDYARFNYDSSSVYLEIYYSVLAEKIDASDFANVGKISKTLDFFLKNAENDSTLAKSEIAVNFTRAASMAGNAGQAVKGIIKLVVPNGKYIAQMIAGDTTQLELSVTSFQSDKITMSDLQLCSNIITNYSATDDPFYKNSMRVVPNPTSTYNKSFARLYYYLELYNLQAEGIQPDSKINLQVAVVDREGKIRLQKNYFRDHRHKSTVERGAFALNRLETGLYTLIFAVSDSVRDIGVYRRRNFYMHNPDVVLVKSDDQEEAAYMVSIFKNMPEATLDEMFAECRYVATPSELNVYKVLNSVETKRKFLFRFWYTRNQQEENAQENYFARVNYANENYRVGGTEGWKTDLGRVYIVYGEPDNIDIDRGNRFENPSQTWNYYELQGGVEFIFVDYSNYGLFKLVHSTMRGEIYDPNWKTDIQTQQRIR